MKSRKLKRGMHVISKWQYSNGYPREGFLPEGYDGDGTAFIQWDDDGSQEWGDRTSFIPCPTLKDSLKLIR